MKRCSGCKTEKPTSDFSRNKRRHDGLNNYCRVCWRSISRTQYLKNRDVLASRYREKRNSGVPRAPQMRSPVVACDQCGLKFRTKPDSGVTSCLPCRHGKSIQHGTCSTYQRGCRCRPCTDAASGKAVENRRKRLLAAGLPDDNRHRTRARRNGGRYEPIDRLAVFERDGWVCGICGDNVDRTLPWPDPLCVSLDHKVALSRGGDHTYENVQCAHLRCNQEKRDREVAYEPPA